MPEKIVAGVYDVTFQYTESATIFSHFTWEVFEGESWAVIGPSGCGKTTLMYLLAGLRFPNSGRIQIEGSDLVGPRNSTGLILQDRGLLPWATASQNIDLGLKIRKFTKIERKDIVTSWLNKIGMVDLGNRYPHQLSGGQRQRIAIARTLCLNPSLLLMDEPFSGLDAITRESLHQVALDLGITTGMNSIIITHDIQEAIYLGKKIMVLPGGAENPQVILNNPGAGDPNYLESPEFQQMYKLLRNALKPS